MKSKGGFIFIEINKKAKDITNADFDVKQFKDILDNNCKKPLIFTTLDETFLMRVESNISETSKTIRYYFVEYTGDVGESISGVYSISISVQWVSETNTYSVGYTYYFNEV